MSGNLLTVFPIVFKNLKSLDVLDLSRNKIVSIPDDVSQIYAVELILNQNQISTLSQEVNLIEFKMMEKWKNYKLFFIFSDSKMSQIKNVKVGRKLLAIISHSSTIIYRFKYFRSNSRG